MQKKIIIKTRTTDEDNKNADAIQFCRNHLQTRHQSPEAVAFSREAISRIIRFSTLETHTHKNGYIRNIFTLIPFLYFSFIYMMNEK